MESTRPILIDLHRHLDGNIRLSTIIELAKKNKITIPHYDLPSLSEEIHVQGATPSLLAFLEKLDTGVSVIASIEDCFRIAYENVLDAASEGLDYTELRFSPYYMAQNNNLPMYAVVKAVIDGVQQGSKDTGLPVNLIGILSRTYGVDICHAELGAILSHKDGIVALDLAGDEAGFPADLFQSHFNKARDAGFQITVHAGEADGPDSVYNAISLLGATRIGHAVNAYKDPKLMEFMAKNEIGIESCLLSNYHTHTFMDLASHPVKTFLEYDITVCLNTDDPGVSNNTLASEYELAKNTLKLNPLQIQTLQNNALEMAFLSADEKKALKTKILNAS